MPTRSSTAMCLALLLLPQSFGWCAEARPIELTAEQAVDRALANNARWRIAVAEALAARERAKAAGKPDPIRFSLNPATLLEQFAGTLSHVLGISHKRKYASRAARHELAAVLAGNEEFRLELIAATRATYWDLAVAQQRVDVLADDVGRAEEVSEAVRELAASGAAPSDEVERARAELAEVGEDLAAWQSSQSALQAQLALLLGEPAQTPFVAIDELRAPAGALPSADDLVALALAKRPALVLVAALRDAAKAGVGLAKAQRRPEVSIGAAFDELQLFGTASLEFPLIDFGSIRHSIRASQANEDAAAAEIEAVRQLIGTEIVTSRAQLQEASGRLRSIEEERLPRVRRLLEAARQRFEAGAETRLAVTSAQRDLNSVCLDQLQGLQDVLGAVAGLERAVGAPIDGRLDEAGLEEETQR